MSRHRAIGPAMADDLAEDGVGGDDMLTVLVSNCVPLVDSCRERMIVFFLDHAKMHHSADHRIRNARRSGSSSVECARR
jgi:hypothetical protein